MDVLLGIVINHDFANAKTLEQLLIYERRIESSLYRTIAELKKAKNMRKEQKEETAWAEAHPTNDCANEANLEDNGWHPPFGSEPQGRRQAELGDGSNCINHPHPEKSVFAAIR